MMSITTIHRMSQEQGELAKSLGKVPIRFNFHDVKTFPPFPFPFLGDYTPDNFSPLLDKDKDEITLFCDSSGMGGENEPALSVEQLKDQLESLVLQYGQTTGNLHAHLYGAIIELGEHQLMITLYTKREGSC